MKYKLLSALGIILFIGTWQLFTDVLHVVPELFLPSPLQIMRTFIDKLTNPQPDGKTILVHIIYSLQVVFTGFGIGTVLGVFLGICMGWWNWVDYIVTPLFSFFRMIPVLAYIPLIIVLLGIGVTAKATVTVIAVLVPTIINTYRGIKQTNIVHLWTVKTMGATRWQMLFKVAIPSALPSIFTGVKIGLSNALVTLVASEMLGAVAGIGFMMQIGRLYSRSDLILLGMMVLGVLGLLTSAVTDWIESKLVKDGR